MTERDFLTAYSQAARGYAYHAAGETGETGRIGYFSLPMLDAEPGIAHGFSARTGGVSPGDFASLNLSLTRECDRANARENFHRFAKAAGFPVESMVLDHYEHGTTVRRVDRNDLGAGFFKEPLPFCDGIVTDDPAVTLITGHADCLAYYAYDPVRRCIGLAHAGWRGALHRIGKNLIDMLAAEYGANPADVLAGVGPGICPACFEVGEDVGEEFEAAFPNTACRRDGKPGKAFIDLQRISACQFFEAGILPHHLAFMDVCTMEEPRLFSHRRDKGRTGGMAAFLRLLPGEKAAFPARD